MIEFIRGIRMPLSTTSMPASEQAVRCEAGAQAVAVGSGEEFDALVRNELYGKVRRRSGSPVGTWLPVGGPDELEPGLRENVQRGDRLGPCRLCRGGRRARILGRRRCQLS
ncbi:hypothetical protein VXC91_34815 [Streptomyces chiangmaiensis]|uniref:Uncharacterized protein n=1 Tax=Streptomyces chiangmaiensis TaxID=766497 RepID=A0ABU7FSL4_9ACTN|nr:hypothetical protein [Streptomyces chiangmaiensis]MED7826969.1 hypothetical protein [Streptomyces chiangmaiensis]